jgi:hypothetical protein
MIEWPPHPTCALPVIRLQWDDDADEYHRIVEPCGEKLYLETADSEWVDADGPAGTDGSTWKLACLNGHVLLVPDDGGNEQYEALTFLWHEAVKAISPYIEHRAPEAS